MDIYGGRSPSDLGVYRASELARFLRLPYSTVRSWLYGTRHFDSVIVPEEHGLLSFTNLVEMFVLQSLRRSHDLQLSAIRRAMAYLRVESGSLHPLADCELLTDKRDLFVEQLGQYLNVSHFGQVEMKKVLRECMSRVGRKAGRIEEMYPYSRAADSPRLIRMDPCIRHGSPCISGTSVPTEVVYFRSESGESLRQLQRDYECSYEKVKEAVRFEQYVRAA